VNETERIGTNDFPEDGGVIADLAVQDCGPEKLSVVESIETS